jgi:hypothetical protein
MSVHTCEKKGDGSCSIRMKQMPVALWNALDIAPRFYAGMLRQIQDNWCHPLQMSGRSPATCDPCVERLLHTAQRFNALFDRRGSPIPLWRGMLRRLDVEQICPGNAQRESSPESLEESASRSTEDVAQTLLHRLSASR